MSHRVQRAVAEYKKMAETVKMLAEKMEEYHSFEKQYHAFEEALKNYPELGNAVASTMAKTDTISSDALKLDKKSPAVVTKKLL